MKGRRTGEVGSHWFCYYYYLAVFAMETFVVYIAWIARFPVRVDFASLIEMVDRVGPSSISSSNSRWTGTTVRKHSIQSRKYEKPRCSSGQDQIYSFEMHLNHRKHPYVDALKRYRSLGLCISFASCEGDIHLPCRLQGSFSKAESRQAGSKSATRWTVCGGMHTSSLVIPTSPSESSLASEVPSVSSVYSLLSSLLSVAFSLPLLVPFFDFFDLRLCGLGGAAGLPSSSSFSAAI